MADDVEVEFVPRRLQKTGRFDEFADSFQLRNASKEEEPWFLAGPIGGWKKRLLLGHGCGDFDIMMRGAQFVQLPLETLRENDGAVATSVDQTEKPAEVAMLPQLIDNVGFPTSIEDNRAAAEKPSSQQDQTVSH